MKARNPEKLADLCAYPLQIGRDEIQTRELAVALFTAEFAFVREIHEFSVSKRNITTLADDEAMLEGYMKGKITYIDGSTDEDEGEVIFYFRKVGGSWKIAGW